MCSQIDIEDYQRRLRALKKLNHALQIVYTKKNNKITTESELIRTIDFIKKYLKRSLTIQEIDYVKVYFNYNKE